jgi:hypothetical protein
MSNKRQSHGLTLPQSSSSRDSVVSNILNSLATLDETAHLQWIKETSRQVDGEREFQRREDASGSTSVARRTTGSSRHPALYIKEDIPEEPDYAAPGGVGYRHTRKNGSVSIPADLIPVAAPSPTVPMGRPAKGGFFRRFMGFGPKVATEDDLVLASPPPKRSFMSSVLNGQVTVWSTLLT